MRGFEGRLRSDAQSDKEPFHGEDQGAAGWQVMGQVTSVDSKHDANAAHITITLNPDYYTIRWLTLRLPTVWVLMAQTLG